MKKRAIIPKWVMGFTSKFSNNQREATLLQNVK
jgi:hypothetical protein